MTRKVLRGHEVRSNLRAKSEHSLKKILIPVSLVITETLQIVPVCEREHTLYALTAVLMFDNAELYN